MPISSTVKPFTTRRVYTPLVTLHGSLDFGKSKRSTADINSENPTRIRPMDIPPDRFVSTPIVNGPTKPPRFPIELMNAIPAAADNPDRNSLGSDQNGPRKL